jgi:RNA polymerase sigma-70 factor (ECF subfamily)
MENLDDDQARIESNGRNLNFNKLHQTFDNFVRRHVKNHLRDPQSIDDVVQDIWMKVNLNIASYDPTLSLPYTWLKNITENTVSNANRACKTKYYPTLVDIDATDVADDIKQSEMPNYDGVGLKQAMQNLPTRTKTLLEMHYFGGYSQAEIAKMLKKPLSTVKDIIQKGQKTLRELLKKDIEQYHGY